MLHKNDKFNLKVMFELYLNHFILGTEIEVVNSDT